MTLLNNRKQQIIIEDDSNSEDVEVKSEEESNNEFSDSEKESGNETKSLDSENDNKDSESDNDQPNNNAGWADSVAKILKTNKPKNKKTLVLSKAKKLTDIVKKEKPVDIGFQIDNEIKEESDPVIEKLKTDINEPIKKKAKKEKSTVRVRPNILDKDRERTLTKIATKGVVQLFNSVQMQQKDIDTKLKEAGPLVRKRENAMKNIDRRAFLDVLMQKKSISVDENIKNEANSGKKTSQVQTSWSVLRDDFMMGAKMKDWDKEDEDNDSEVDNLSDSD